MGADIMVIPRGYSLELQNAFLRSEPNTFYMEENLADKISEVPRVENNFSFNF